MKRSLESSDSLGASMSVCPPTADEHRGRNKQGYRREFQSMLEDLEEEGCCIEESGHGSEKKRRLSVEQVKTLEKNFEVENKLEPERKVKLAQKLGLQPRQVAVWFQNRRARWKTKQMERDYGVLKANYDALKLNLDSLQRDKESLLKEVRELKAKLKEENTEGNNSIKEEIILHESNNKEPAQATQKPHISTDANEPPVNNLVPASHFPDFKDGSSDSSDSSAILNEDNNANNNSISSPNCYQAISSSGIDLQTHHLMVSSPSSPPMYHNMQFVKMEEHNFFSSEEACSFFSDEQWYCNDQWN